MIERMARVMAARTITRPWDRMDLELQAGFLADAEVAYKKVVLPALEIAAACGTVET